MQLHGHNYHLRNRDAIVAERMKTQWPPSLDLPDQANVRWTSITKIIRDPEQNWPRQILERPIIHGQVGSTTVALIADPEAAKTVLAGGEQRFPKWKLYERMFARGLGRKALSVVPGEQWRRQQRAFAPMFQPDRISALAAISGNVTERSCAAWLQREGDIVIDTAAEMMRITLSSIWSFLFGADDGDLGPALIGQAAAAIAAAQISGRVDETPKQLTALAIEADRRGLGFRAVLSGDGPSAPRSDSLSADRALSPTELFDNTRLLLGAGSETTALSLTWALWLLAHMPDVQRQAQEEIERVAGAEPFAVGHVARLSFVGQVLKETLRLCPPSVVLVRQSRGEELLAGEELPPGSILAVCQYALHRHTLWWDAPEEFRPERFSAGEPRHLFALLPFGGGQHACMGRQAGWVELVIVLATILRRFQLVADRSVTVKPHISIHMDPDRKLPILLRPRG